MGKMEVSSYRMDAIDRARLERLPEIGMEILQALGFVAIGKSGALFRYGYLISKWYHVISRTTVLEYKPRELRKGQPLPRVTAWEFEHQVEIHRALGIGLVPRGIVWSDNQGSPGLFDAEIEGREV
jgi:hypothetical protein